MLGAGHAEEGCADAGGEGCTYLTMHFLRAASTPRKRLDMLVMVRGEQGATLS